MDSFSVRAHGSYSISLEQYLRCDPPEPAFGTVTLGIRARERHAALPWKASFTLSHRQMHTGGMPAMLEVGGHKNDRFIHCCSC